MILQVSAGMPCHRPSHKVNYLGMNRFVYGVLRFSTVFWRMLWKTAKDLKTAAEKIYHAQMMDFISRLV
jgi:hypothetical protein